MTIEAIGLAEAISLVRSELKKAQEHGRESEVRFTVGAVEVEFIVDVTRKADGGASVKVLGLLSLGGQGELSHSNTHRVKISLNPLGVNGQPFEVASVQDRRPDAE